MGIPCSLHGRCENRIWTFCRKFEVKRPFSRTGSTWKDIIKMDFKELECEVLDYIQLAQGRGQW
jgi:hypothetical protein